ncbi:MAG: BlaI/MecI/CopY family transcriptional regulator [Gemmatimonadetes bacterium]|nr:BlaI/MecI/CopY family transcriptional regulator [Gemmatimonadota bacterium]
MSDSHSLTGLQVALLRVLWQRGEASVAEICEALRPDRALAPTTVATVLSRLEKRGVVTHRREARQFVYRAEITEGDVRGSMVQELTERLFHGDVAELVNHLLSAREIGSDDLARVKQLVEAHEKGTEVSRGKR